MKGFSISTIIGLIIGLIILIVLTPLLFKAASNVWDQLAETLGIVKYSPIERAMICYYYLCRGDAGCRDSAFNDFCSPDKIGRENYEELCSLPASLAVDGRQCGSFQFPLKIQLDNNAEIYKDRLKKKVDTTHLLIVTEQTSGRINWNEVLFNLIPFAHVWTIYRGLTETVAFFTFRSRDLTNVEEESYALFGTIYSPLVKFANVKSGTYYVSGAKISGLVDPPKYFIFVDSFPRYLSLTPGRCYNNLEVKPGQIIRISVEDEKTENLKDYNYLMNMSSGVFSYKPTFSIKFWNATNARNPATQSYTCENFDCSEKKQFVFNTRKRTIKIEVQKIESSLHHCYGQVLGCDYKISKFNLAICRQ
jgi:hypothetical protein